jgi:hypothetical protein
MESNQIFVMLTPAEMGAITGGEEGRTLLGDVAYVLGVGAKCIYNFCVTASTYQASLPPSLKK